MNMYYNTQCNHTKLRLSVHFVPNLLKRSIPQITNLRVGIAYSPYGVRRDSFTNSSSQPVMNPPRVLSVTSIPQRPVTEVSTDKLAKEGVIRFQRSRFTATPVTWLLFRDFFILLPPKHGLVAFLLSLFCCWYHFVCTWDEFWHISIYEFSLELLSL